MCIVLQDYKGTMPRDLISDFLIFTYIHNTHTYTVHDPELTVFGLTCTVHLQYIIC